MFLNLKKITAPLALLAVAALVASGCGSDDATSAYTKTAATQSTTVASAASVSTKSTKLGTVLSGEDGKTLYLFEADKGNKSACSGDCAAVWPPAIASGKVTVSGDADQSKVGTVSGTKQITYAGHPLYYYVKDTDDEDTYGNDIDSFGAEWYALTATGAKPSDDAAKSEESKSDDDSGSKSSGY